MAGDWIKMRRELGQDPDVIQIAALLNLDEFAVVGRLHAVWSWLDQHSESGTNVRIVSAYLDRLTACPGFADAMRAVKWLDGRDGNLTFPGYETHNGETAKRRAYETKRKQIQRDKRPATSGTNVPSSAGLEKRREDSKEREKAGAKPDPITLQAQRIVEAYPRREKVADALAIVHAHLMDGDSFEAMLAGTKAAAAVIRTLPSGASNRYVPGAEAFFKSKRWADDPETLKRQGNTKSGTSAMSDDELVAQLGGRAVNLD